MIPVEVDTEDLLMVLQFVGMSSSDRLPQHPIQQSFHRLTNLVVVARAEYSRSLNAWKDAVLADETRHGFEEWLNTKNPRSTIVSVDEKV